MLQVNAKPVIGDIGEDLVVDDEQEDRAVLRQRLGLVDALDLAGDVG